MGPADRPARPLYTQAERHRRDTSRWTLVQGVLAPLQFAIFLVSLVLVLRALATGAGFAAAEASVVVKTLALYAIMITGSIWEKAVFGRFLFAPAFFWEDVVSMLVLALHTAYLAALATGALRSEALLVLALAAYATYVVNAGQFVLKLRAARLQGSGPARALSAEVDAGSAQESASQQRFGSVSDRNTIGNGSKPRLAGALS
ncbi:3-vinyl bacteriochlorophyllide hydratase [Methylobacterium phyllostachyos]|uniref:3-vinyl bacteriochlorophyllide hydratase n=1 Tax=Methylobacterium phyllostachyos TaxID=582672 RepID=A0A1H0IT17_9HYPH|nr:3-vinyl bacteriochlorophyllide hydratase [Methylobacterium phyllostachyos]